MHRAERRRSCVISGRRRRSTLGAMADVVSVRKDTTRRGYRRGFHGGSVPAVIAEKHATPNKLFKKISATASH